MALKSKFLVCFVAFLVIALVAFSVALCFVPANSDVASAASVGSLPYENSVPFELSTSYSGVGPIVSAPYYSSSSYQFVLPFGARSATTVEDSFNGFVSSQLSSGSLYSYFGDITDIVFTTFSGLRYSLILCAPGSSYVASDGDIVNALVYTFFMNTSTTYRHAIYMISFGVTVSRGYVLTPLSAMRVACADLSLPSVTSSSVVFQGYTSFDLTSAFNDGISSSFNVLMPVYYGNNSSYGALFLSAPFMSSRVERSFSNVPYRFVWQYPNCIPFENVDISYDLSGDYGQGYADADEKLRNYYDNYISELEASVPGQVESARQAGYNAGFAAGKTEGIESANDYTFLGLIGAVVDAPLSALTGLLNVEILGINLSTFIFGLIMLSIGVTIVRWLL